MLRFVKEWKSEEMQHPISKMLMEQVEKGDFTEKQLKAFLVSILGELDSQAALLGTIATECMEEGHPDSAKLALTRKTELEQRIVSISMLVPERLPSVYPKSVCNEQNKDYTPSEEEVDCLYEITQGLKRNKRDCAYELKRANGDIREAQRAVENLSMFRI